MMMQRAAHEALDLLAAEDQRLRGRLRFDPELEVFAGHFPGRPLVPGVLLLEAVRALVERARGEFFELAAARAVKFTREVAPGEAVLLEARLEESAAAGLSCRATIRTEAGDEECARLRLEFRPTGGR